MAGKIVADTFDGTDSTETVSGVSVTIPTSVGSKYVVNGTLKAWASTVDSTGTTISNSLNVSSKTDESAAGEFNYTLIASAQEEMDASAFSGMGYGGDRNIRCGTNDTTTSVFDLRVHNTAGSGNDAGHSWMWVGELA